MFWKPQSLQLTLYFLQKDHTSHTHSDITSWDSRRQTSDSMGNLLIQTTMHVSTHMNPPTHTHTLQCQLKILSGRLPLCSSLVSPIVLFYVCMLVCEALAFLVPQKARREHWLPWDQNYQKVVSHHGGFWELNVGSLKSGQSSLSTEPSLRPLMFTL